MVWKTVSFYRRRVYTKWSLVANYIARSVLESVVLLLSLMMRYPATFCKVAIFCPIPLVFYGNMAWKAVSFRRRIEMDARGVFYRSFGDGVGGVVVFLDDEVFNYFL